VIFAGLALCLAGCGDEPSNVAVPQASTPAGAPGATTPRNAAKPGAPAAGATTPGEAAAEAGGATGQPAPTGTATKAQFITSADPICRDYNVHALAILKSFSDNDIAGPQGRKKIGDTIDTAYQSMKADQAKVAALPRPPDKQATEYVEVMNERVSLLPKFADAIRDTDIGAIQKNGAKLKDLIEKSHDVATDYGFKECGRGG
jgi:hypothetical protein